jgi:hypothetical protein
LPPLHGNEPCYDLAVSLAPLINYRAQVAEDEEGLAWFLEDLDAINRVLVDNGLPRHEERQQNREALGRITIDRFQ